MNVIHSGVLFWTARRPRVRNDNVQLQLTSHVFCRSSDQPQADIPQGRRCRSVLMALVVLAASWSGSLGCRGPSEEGTRLNLRIDPSTMQRDWPKGPRKEAVNADLKKEAGRFARRLFKGEPMPTEIPAGGQVRDVDEALDGLKRPSALKEKAPPPPRWSKGTPEPPRSAEHDLPKAWPVVVRQGEQLHLLAKWAGMSVDAIRDDNRDGLGKRKWLRVGDRLSLTMSLNQKFAFDQARDRFQDGRVANYFSKRYVAKVIVYRVKRGEMLANAARRYGDVPIWLLQEFNQTDFRVLQPGDEILIPVVEKYTSRRRLPPKLQVVDEEEEAVTGEALAEIQGKLSQDLLGKARLAIDDSNVFERAGPDEVVRADARKILPDYGQMAAPKPVVSAEVQADAPKPRAVVVKKGETLSHYSRWSGLTLQQITNANLDTDANTLSIGAKVRLPLDDTGYAAFVMARSKAQGIKVKPTARQNNMAVSSNQGVPGQAVAVQPAPAPVKQAPKPNKAHVVKPGETATAIAVKHKTTVYRLRRLNPRADLDRLRIGQKVLLPGS